VILVLIQVENKGANLDGLPLRCIRRARAIRKRSVRREKSFTGIRVPAFDEDDLIWRLIGKVIPLVGWVVFDAVSVSVPIRVNEA